MIRVDWYSAGTDALIHSASLEPNDPEEFEFTVLDRKGKRAPWLQAKLEEGDEDDIYNAFMERRRESFDY